MKKAIFLFLTVLFAPAANAQVHKLYPVFIYSFTRYIQWPDQYNTGDFEIIVIGDTPALTELDAMASTKKVGDRKIKITRIKSITEIRKCNILFIPTSHSKFLKEILQKIQSQSILVITEEPGLASQGSCINFIVKDDKLAFELNQAAMTRFKLKVSNELTRIAIMI
jgi:hypothetical protein